MVTTEYERMGMGPSDRTGMKYRPWRITQCNDKYKYGHVNSLNPVVPQHYPILLEVCEVVHDHLPTSVCALLIIPVKPRSAPSDL